MNNPWTKLIEGELRFRFVWDTRVVDARTEHAVLVLAGCGRDGTTAAGEFVSEPKYLETLAGQAPRGWSRQNLQVVIATDPINGHSGARIIATYFW